MTRLTCQDCHMQFNSGLDACPNCGTRPPSVWQRMTHWRWPLPLAIGLVLQTLSQHGQLERGSKGAREALTPLPEVALVSEFLAGVLIFSGLAALLLFAVHRIRIAWQRRLSRRRRSYSGQQRSG